MWNKINFNETWRVCSLSKNHVLLTLHVCVCVCVTYVSFDGLFSTIDPVNDSFYFSICVYLSSLHPTPSKTVFLFLTQSSLVCNYAVYVALLKHPTNTNTKKIYINNSVKMLEDPCTKQTIRSPIRHVRLQSLIIIIIIWFLQLFFVSLCLGLFSSILISYYFYHVSCFFILVCGFLFMVKIPYNSQWWSVMHIWWLLTSLWQ